MANAFSNSIKPPLGQTLAQGVQTLSAHQLIGFDLYQRYVFPLDGMVYWIRVPTGTITTPGLQPCPALATATVNDGECIQVTPGGLVALDIVGGHITNPLLAQDQGLVAEESLFVDFTGPCYPETSGTTIELEPGEDIVLPAGSIAWVNAFTGGHQFTAVLQKQVDSVKLPTHVDVQGSLHYDSAVDQREDATVDSNTVIFSSLSEVQAFNQISANHLYIATYNDLRFAFSSRGFLYEQADLYHYVGKALFSTNQTQIVDDPADFKPSLVVSNSLPIWLSMPGYVPPYPGFTCPLMLYPSFLVDDNIEPPFGAVHIYDTLALEQRPWIGRNSEAAQLCREKVRVTMYGADNAMASDFRDFVEQYSTDWMTIGIASVGAIQDEKHPQQEMKILAQRKHIEFEVNYLQSVSRDIARQFIEGAKVQFTEQWLRQ